MNKSLQDQLLALGLAKQAPKSRGGNKPAAKKQQKTAQRSPRGKPAGKATDGENLTLEQAYRLRQQQEKQQAAQARQRKQAEDRRRRELNESIRAIVQPHRLNDPAAELSRNFLYKGRIRKVSVTADQLRDLNDGVLGLVYLAGGYHVLPLEQVEQVRALSADHVPDLGGDVSQEEEEFPVPDDLIW